MKKSLLALAIAVASAAPLALGQTTSTSTGGAGGAGGSAAGGQASGGTATNSNNTSGVANAVGGSSQGGTGGSASGGQASSTAAGGNVGTVSTGGSQASLGDVTVNYNAGSSPMGKDGLGVGVDPNTGHIVTDNTVKYSGSYKLKNTPDVSVGGPASGPCNGFSGGLGFSMAGMSVGANASTVDEGCTARETARVAAMIGRMDIANAVLENLPAVQAALRSKATRDAVINAPAPRSEVPAAPVVPATTKPLPNDPKVQATREAALKAQQELDRAIKDAELKENQRLASEALNRNATMYKVNDTLRFTDAQTQLLEKTPQEVMAEEASKKPASDIQQASVKKETQQGQQQAATQQQPQPQAVTTTPLPAPPPVQPQLQASMQQVMNLKSETVGGGASPGAGKALEKASALSPQDRINAAKSALNLK